MLSLPLYNVDMRILTTGDRFWSCHVLAASIIRRLAHLACFGLIDRSIRGVTWRPDALCTFVTIDSRTVTSYGVCHVLITSWAEMP